MLLFAVKIKSIPLLFVFFFIQFFKSTFFVLIQLVLLLFKLKRVKPWRHRSDLWNVNDLLWRSGSNDDKPSPNTIELKYNSMENGAMEEEGTFSINPIHAVESKESDNENVIGNVKIDEDYIEG